MVRREPVPVAWVQRVMRTAHVGRVVIVSQSVQHIRACATASTVALRSARIGWASITSWAWFHHSIWLAGRTCPRGRTVAMVRFAVSRADDTRRRRFGS